ncbi:MAG: DUF4150 domain-containing protein [Deltaproteobacteria bacterium]|nr:DUF4150 domain-containing protein [Deltaproteobacteria bacterium]
MLANTQMMGMDLGFPDVVLTPPVMVPIPYPNVAAGPMGLPAAYNVLQNLTNAPGMRIVPSQPKVLLLGP